MRGFNALRNREVRSRGPGVDACGVSRSHVGRRDRNDQRGRRLISIYTLFDKTSRCG
jgi:hypothetical protein